MTFKTPIKERLQQKKRKNWKKGLSASTPIKERLQLTTN